MKAERPTYAQVLTWLEERRSVLEGMHKEMRHDQDYYLWSSKWVSQMWQPYVKGFPPGYVAKRPPVAFLGVQRAINMMMVGETPEVQVVLPDDYLPKTGTNKKLDAERERKRRETADKIRSWVQAALYTVDTYSTETPLRDFFTQLLSMGLGVLEYPIDWDRWEDPPFGYLDDDMKRPRRGSTPEEKNEFRRWLAKRQRTFPWAVASRHPLTIFFDPYHEPPRDFIIEDQVAVKGDEQAVRQAGLAANTQQRVIYCSPDWYGIWVGGVPLLTAEDGADDEGVAKNSLGMPWYRMAWSGFGANDETGDFTYRGKGIIRDSRDQIITKLLLLNIRLLILHKAAYQELVFQGAGAEALRDEWAENAGPGAAIANEGMGVTIDLVPVPATPKEVFDIERVNDQLLEMVMGPDILEGVYRPETAAGMRTRSGFAKAPYRAPQQSGQQTIAAMCLDWLYQIKDVPELRSGVTVQGITFKPEDIPDGVLLKINIAPPTEEDRAFKRQALKEDLEAGLLTEEDYIRETRPLEDPGEYRQKVLVEQFTKTLLSNEQILNVGLQQVLQRLGVPPAQPALPAPPQQPGLAVPPEAPPMPEQEPALGSAGEAQQMVEQVYNSPLLPGAPQRVGVA